MRKEGLGEKAEFYGYHPVVNFVYFAFVIILSMFSIHPVFLVLSLAGGWTYAILLKGIKALKFNLLLMLAIIVVMVVINTLTAHDGDTVLFYLNNNRVTLEAMVYGLATALLLSGIIIWFSSFNVIMTSEKFIFLFGRIVPVLALTISMIFRFIPLFKQRFGEITNGQHCMGRSFQSGSLIKRMRQLLKEVSILIAWSLEASIETSDSMEARGYGLHGRTSFYLYRFTKRDLTALICILIFGGLSLTGCIFGKTSMYYYPLIRIPWEGIGYPLTAICYACLMLVPVVIDIRGEKRWKQLSLEI